ncbi:MAG: hypothetical protein SGPRY_010623, partial [Prymnesium sp.]
VAAMLLLALPSFLFPPLPPCTATHTGRKMPRVNPGRLLQAAAHTTGQRKLFCATMETSEECKKRTMPVMEEKAIQTDFQPEMIDRTKEDNDNNYLEDCLDRLVA